MLEHKIPYSRPLQGGYTDCDPKWRCVDVHEAKTSKKVTSLVSRACVNFKVKCWQAAAKYFITVKFQRQYMCVLVFIKPLA